MDHLDYFVDRLVYKLDDIMVGQCHLCSWPMYGVKAVALSNLIMHLNDYHNISFGEIADEIDRRMDLTIDGEGRVNVRIKRSNKSQENIQPTYMDRGYSGANGKFISGMP